MDFELSEEQRALAQMARDVFAKLSSPQRLRDLWEGGEPDPQTWATLAELGLSGLTVPTAHGGMGGDLIDLSVVLEEAGRTCLSEPLLETAGIAVPLLLTTDQAGAWLPAIAAGEKIATVALATHGHALDADRAHVLLIERDGILWATDDFTATRLVAEDRARRLFTVDARQGTPVSSAEEARRLGALGTAALLNGVSLRLLEMTIEHVKVRQQFGRPVGAFQAVKHKLASVYATVESSRAATRYAAYAAARGLPDAPTAISAAKVHAVEAASLANTEALQCHGGIGFTWEHDLHFWLKRGRALEHAYGEAREHRALLADALLGDEQEH